MSTLESEVLGREGVRARGLGTSKLAELLVLGRRLAAISMPLQRLKRQGGWSKRSKCLGNPSSTGGTWRHPCESVTGLDKSPLNRFKCRVADFTISVRPHLLAALDRMLLKVRGGGSRQLDSSSMLKCL